MKHSTMCQTGTATAYVTKGKQRIKQFNGTVYLEDKDNFEVELFNPFTYNILAKIDVNNQSLGNGIVIRPGERVFLERFLDNNKKFQFTTYTVSGSNKQVREAIQSNGNVSVKFYKERIYNYTDYGNWYNNSGTYTTYPTYDVPHTFTTNSGTTNMLYDANVSFTTSGLSSLCINTDANVGIGTENPLAKLDVSGNTPKACLDSVETGRVSKGESSNQRLETVDMDFEYNPFHTVEWKILPKSQQRITASDIKQYCVSCGTRIKKTSYKYCPNCGTQIN